MRKIFCGVLRAFVFIIYFVVCPSYALGVSSPEEFCDQYIGESVDVDNYPANQPYQCYDLWAKFIMDQYGTSMPVIITPTGCAEDIWHNFEGLGLSAYFTKASGSPQDGDWVIYDWPGSSYSHVGMFRWDNGDGTIMVLHQNYLGQTKVTQDSMTKNYILGYIRPNIYTSDLQEPPSEAIISITKNKVAVGEDVTFNFGAANAAGFTVRIEKNGERIDSKDFDSCTSYTRSFSNPGDYSAYVKAFNDEGFVKSERLSFTVVPRHTYPGHSSKIPTRGNPVREGDSTPMPQQRPISVVVNGNPVSFDQPPVSINGRVMVPLRFIAQHMGAYVDWSMGIEKITVKQPDRTLELRVGSNNAFVDGKLVLLDTQPVIKNSRTLVPVRFISENLGAEVNWVVSSQTVTINQ